jgi:hypothetical protein
VSPVRRDGVQGGGTQRQCIDKTGETLFGPAEAIPSGREAYTGKTRKRSNDAGQGAGGGRTTDEPQENRGGKGRYFHQSSKAGKGNRTAPAREGFTPVQSSQAQSAREIDNVRKLQRTLYRVAKQQPERRFTLLDGKVCRHDILQEAWRRVKSNKSAAGVDDVDIDEIRKYGEARFLGEIEQELRNGATIRRRFFVPRRRGSSRRYLLRSVPTQKLYPWRSNPSDS